jgi:hypothetical protein
MPPIHILSDLSEDDHVGQNMFEDNRMYLKLTTQCSLLVRFHTHCQFFHGHNAVL